MNQLAVGPVEVFQKVHLERFLRAQHGKGDHDLDYNALEKQQMAVQSFFEEEQNDSVPYQRMLQNLDLGYHLEGFHDEKNHVTVVLDVVRVPGPEAAIGWKVDLALVHYVQDQEAALLVR